VDLATAAITVPIDSIVPNPWNPNVQPAWIFQKELKSIKKFGFVDPLTVREIRDDSGREVEYYQIVDGEHRWKGAKELGLTELPVWNLGVIDDADAEELTVVLNETRGAPNETKLAMVLDDLIKRRGDEDVVRDIMPFNRTRFDEIIGSMHVDWDALEKRRVSFDATEGRWKEVVFRMPHDAAKVVEDAIARVKDQEDFKDDWKALEMICADSLA
jgi:hypothetical protein